MIPVLMIVASFLIVFAVGFRDDRPIRWENDE